MSTINEKIKEYVKEQNKAEFKIGDKVKILREAKHHEQGWNDFWTSLMYKNIGRTGIIKDIRRDMGISVEINDKDNRFNYPYFILKKVNKDTTTKTDKPKSKDEWNSKCPICNSDSYFGFTSLECSNPSCTNFKKG